MDTVSSAADLSLEIRRSFQADPSRLFAAWTQADALKRWFAPNPAMTVTVHALDLRAGGRFRIEMTEPSGTAHIVCGTYTHVEPPRRLVFTWQWEGQAEESLVSLDITAHDGGESQLLLRHTRFVTEASRAWHSQGWDACIARLATAL
jgi:uncharacterized protein YndB with AHSA1/START domain